jgi:fucose 4-O-acetylase-like acetyltransferase
MESKAHTRINYLDWLRVGGILFVFVYHTTRLYNVEDWVVKNQIWYPSVEVWNTFVTSFMMPLMFVISGASLFCALGKGGFGKFLKDKVLRLLVPAFHRHVGGNLVLAAILAGAGVGNIYGWNLVWPVVLIAIGVLVILRPLVGKRSGKKKRRPPRRSSS